MNSGTLTMTTKTNRIRPLILTTDGRPERLVAVAGTKADGTAAEPVFGLLRGGIVPGSDLDRCLAAIEARFGGAQ